MFFLQTFHCFLELILYHMETSNAEFEESNSLVKTVEHYLIKIEHLRNMKEIKQ